MTITFNGNIGKDAQLRKVNIGGNDVSVCDIWVAENLKQRDGSKKTIWHKVTLWRGYAEKMAQYLKSGRRILVENGTGEAKAYTTKDGRIVPYIAISGARLQFLDAQNLADQVPEDETDVEEEDGTPWDD